MQRLGLVVLLALAVVSSWAEPLEKPGVTYEKKPSGRVYGSDGSISDPNPTSPNKVYDTDGRAYRSNVQTMPNGANTLAKPLPRANTPVGSSTGVRSGVGGVRR